PPSISPSLCWLLSVRRGRRSRPGSSPRSTPPPYRTASPPTRPKPAPTGTPSRWHSRKPSGTRRADSSEPRLRDQAGRPQRQQGADTAASLRRAADTTGASRRQAVLPRGRGVVHDVGDLVVLRRRLALFDHAASIAEPHGVSGHVVNTRPVSSSTRMTRASGRPPPSPTQGTEEHPPEL